MKELLILTPIVLLVIGLVGIIAHERGGLTFAVTARLRISAGSSASTSAGSAPAMVRC